MADSIDEFALIRDMFAPLSRRYAGAMNLTDDAAFIEPRPGHDLVVTVDTLVADVHFFADDPPDQIARKLVRVNLSDLAAKGARPFAVLLAATLPHDVRRPWIEAFVQGLAQDIDSFDLALIGGDTVATPGPLVLSMTAFGHVPAGQGLRRSGGLVGDALWASGTIGDSALGLALREGLAADVPEEDSRWLTGRYLVPRPRTSLGPALVGLAHAAMDISDGLVQDLGHLCRTSGVGAEVYAARIPLSDPARRMVEGGRFDLSRVLNGGDDYELLFAAPMELETTLIDLSRTLDVPLARIGRLVDGQGVVVRGADGDAIPVDSAGWSHFSRR